MDTDTKKEFNKVHESIEKLAISMATGFEQVDQSFEQVDIKFEQIDEQLSVIAKRLGLLEEEVRALREEIKSIRAELKRIPDDIDATYSGTFNDLLDRVAVIEKQLGINYKAKV